MLLSCSKVLLELGLDVTTEGIGVQAFAGLTVNDAGSGVASAGNDGFDAGLLAEREGNPRSTVHGLAPALIVLITRDNDDLNGLGAISVEFFVCIFQASLERGASGSPTGGVEHKDELVTSNSLLSGDVGTIGSLEFIT